MAKAEAMRQARVFLAGFEARDDLEYLEFEKAVRKPFDDATWNFAEEQDRKKAAIEKTYKFNERLPHLRKLWQECDQFNDKMIRQTVDHVRTYLAQGRHRYVYAHANWYPHCYSDNKAVRDRQDREGRYAGPQLIAQSLLELYDDVAGRLQRVSDGLTQKSWTCARKPGDSQTSSQPASVRLQRLPIGSGEHEQVQRLSRELKDIVAARQGTSEGLPIANPWHFPDGLPRFWQMNVDGKPQGLSTPEISLSLGFQLVVSYYPHDGITDRVESNVTSFIESHTHLDRLIRDQGWQKAVASWQDAALEIKVTNNYLMLRGRWQSLVFLHTRQGLFQAWIEANAKVPDDVDGDSFLQSESDIVQALTYLLIDNFIDTQQPPGPETPLGPRLQLMALDGTNNEVPAGSDCRILVTLSTPQQKPLAEKRVVFRHIFAPGSLSSRVVKTDAQGEAVVIFKAPTAAELAKLGTETRVTPIEAIEPDSKAEARLLLTTRTKSEPSAWELTVVAEHDIVPAHSACYNPIEVTLQPKPSTTSPVTTSPKQVRLTVALHSEGTQVHGRLVRTAGDPGGQKSLTIEPPEGVPLRVYYHWTGQGNLPKAAVETVRVSVDGLDVAGQATFDVGIDFKVKSVTRANKTDIIPMFEEPYHVEVIDGFHPDADLVSLAQTWNLMPRLTLTQTAFSFKKGDLGQGVISFLFETLDEGYTSAYWGATIGTHQRVDRWSVRRDGEKVVLFSDEAWDHSKTERRPFPRVSYYARGTHELEFQINRVFVKGAESLDHTDNPPFTYTEKVSEYGTKGDKFLYTVLSPAIEYLALLGASKAVATVATALGCLTTFHSAAETAVEGLDLSPEEHNAYRLKVLNELTNIWSCFADIAAAGNLPKSVTDGLTMNVHANFLKEMLLSWKEVGWGNWDAPPGQKKSNTREESDIGTLDAVQASLRGLNGQYLVIIDRNGLKSHAVTSSQYGRLLAAPAKVPTPQQMQARAANRVVQERMWEGPEIILIPAMPGESLQLHLSGDGGSGKALLLTGSSVRTIQYPAVPWSSSLKVESNGEIKLTGGTDMQIGSIETVFGNQPKPVLQPTPDQLPADAPRLKVSATVVRSRERIDVQFVARPDFAVNAWVGLVPADVPHGAQGPNDNAKLIYQSLRGKPWGKLTFLIPPTTPPGNYQFRMFPSDDDSFDEVASSETIRIE